MDKIKTNIHAIVNDEELVNHIKQNELSKELIEKLHLNDIELVDYFQIIERYLKDHASCINCKSKNDCTHSTKGYAYQLKRDEDNQVTDYLSVCDKYKSYYKKLDNFIYSTFNKEELLDENQKTFFQDNMEKLGESFSACIESIYNDIPNHGAFVTLSDSKLRLKLVKSLAVGLLNKHTVSIVKMNDMLKEIKDNFKNYDALDIVSELKKSEIVIIDGLGSESVSAWTRDDILYSLLDTRIQNGKVTILCSEYNLDELSKIYMLNNYKDLKAERLIEKFKEIIG